MSDVCVTDTECDLHSSIVILIGYLLNYQETLKQNLHSSIVILIEGCKVISYCIYVYLHSSIVILIGSGYSLWGNKISIYILV